ncbi:hypothetical protein [Ferruginibacter albus]|uniref:hypothetical protein n=1 Tax=Ferruginibacter albus TaxID=2875540 RepID=UPI001CC7E8E9|nr:hypothetical protein [Ferruginibacter albus]UAY50786.1 hypothetical protein K9M53_09300 [Ferruginibacter albus]
MKTFIAGLFFVFFSVLHAQCQLTASELNSIAQDIQTKFIQNGDSEATPGSVSKANIFALAPKDDQTTAIIRKLQMSKKFPNSNSLFNWLLPKVNKIFLTHYLYKNDTANKKYDSLFDQINDRICGCITKAHEKKGYNQDSVMQVCFKEYYSDTSFIRKYMTIFKSVPLDKRTPFLRAQQYYLDINCPSLFDLYFKPAQYWLADGYDKELLDYKYSILERIIRYSLYTEKDSLLKFFPAYTQYKKEIEILQKIYKENKNKLGYPVQNYVTDKDFERDGAFIVKFSGSESISVLGQAVYEIGIDKPLYYLKTLKFYPRESLQHVDKIEEKLMMSKKAQNQVE